MKKKKTAKDWWPQAHDDSYNPCQIRVPTESFRPTGQIVIILWMTMDFMRLPMIPLTRS
jgi:hypothetical protein